MIKKTLNKNKDGRGSNSVETQFKKGQLPWNTGISGEELSKHYKIGSVWNKDLSGYKIHSEEHKEKLRISFTGNKFREGKEPWNKGVKGLKREPRSEEIRKRISESLKNHPCYKDKERGKNISIAQKKFFKENPKALTELRERLKRIKTTKQDTKIEVKMQNFLKELGINFFTHQYMKIEHGYLCDILIPSMNLVIECDGDYWHKYPIGNDVDHIRTKELIDNGFKVLRLWDFEIKEMDIKTFETKLNEVKS